jgi:hypothetical protein
MFSKLSLFAAMVVPLVSALILPAPENAVSAGPLTLTWTSEAGDPDIWSFYLFHTTFHDALGIANNVNPALGSVTFTLSAVPPMSGYTVQAVDIGNISHSYATTPPFTIGSLSSVSTGISSSTSPLSSIPLRSTTSTSQISSIIKPASTPSPSPSGTTDTTSGTSIPTAQSFSAASRRFDFKVGGITAAVLAIGGATILAL